MKKETVVIIGQNYNTSLGLIKALGECGYRCEVGKRVKDIPRLATPELKSKYVDRYIYLKTEDDHLMVSRIIEIFSVSGTKKILIPSDDYCAALIDRNLEKLARYFIFPNVKGKSCEVERLMDKLYQKKLIRQYGINVVDSYVVDCRDKSNIRIPHELKYPCFIKPLTSAGKPKILIEKCNTEIDLQRALNNISEFYGCEMLVEQYVEIEKEYTIPGIAIGNEVIIPALLEKNKTGSGYHKGVTISGTVESIGSCRDTINGIKQFVRDSGYQGIFDVELLFSKDIYYFNEMNLRYGAAGYALTYSGINLPGMYADYVSGKTIGAVDTNMNLKFGKKFVNEKAAWEYYIAGYGTFREYIKTLLSTDIHFITTFKDIGPYIYFLRLMLVYFLASLKNRVKL